MENSTAPKSSEDLQSKIETVTPDTEKVYPHSEQHQAANTNKAKENQQNEDELPQDNQEDATTTQHSTPHQGDKPDDDDDDTRSKIETISP
ncbi:hypothetical protein [Pedobacter sp.]|uniref:hypothetical protein n=1 Tax=Pedobacter sp. TaxID=1411316 RepID=UPI003D7F4BD6